MNVSNNGYCYKRHIYALTHLLYKNECRVAGKKSSRIHGSFGTGMFKQPE